VISVVGDNAPAERRTDGRQTEPDVTLTDYALFAECAAFAWLNHNALYRLVQAVGLALLFMASRGLLAPTGRLHADIPKAR
jgi:hypothetical protein